MSALRNAISPSRQGADGEDVPATSESDRILSSDPEHAQANDPVANQEAVDDHPNSGDMTAPSPRRSARQKLARETGAGTSSFSSRDTVPPSVDRMATITAGDAHPSTSQHDEDPRPAKSPSRRRRGKDLANLQSMTMDKKALDRQKLAHEKLFRKEETEDKADLMSLIGQTLMPIALSLCILIYYFVKVRAVGEDRDAQPPGRAEGLADARSDGRAGDGPIGLILGSKTGQIN